MDYTNTLKLAYWNATSVINKKVEIRAFLESHKIDVFLLQETFLKPTHTFNIPNYHTYRNDRSTPGGGTAILVKKNIKHSTTTQLQLNNFETTSVKIHTDNEHITLHSAYLSPGKHLIKEELAKIFDDNSANLLLGDLNSKHADWNSRATNTRGILLQTLAEELQLNVDAPEEPTHIHAPTGSTDVLDITVMKHIRSNYTLTTIHELSTTNHLPVIMELEASIATQTKTITITDWKLFQDTLHIRNTNINNKTDLDEAVNCLEIDIKTALEAATHTKTITNRTQLPIDIKAKIIEKRHIYKEYKRTFDPHTKTQLNKITNTIKQKIQEHYDEQWNKKLETLNTEDKSLWQITRALTKDKREKLPPIHTNTGIVTDDKDKTEAFADHLQTIFTPNPPGPGADPLPCLNQDVEVTTNTIEPVTTDEIEHTIKQLKERKAPGPDGITNTTIKHLTPDGIQAITTITNKILELRHFPTPWKHANIILIKKPRKPKHKLTSYRPISLLHCLSKVTERVLHSRLLEHITQHNILPEFQYGFRQEHSTTQQIARITEHIHKHFNTSTQTAAVFLDIEKAFDKVWHDGLIYKLQRHKFPTQMTQILHSYIQNRTFHVTIDDETSTPKIITAGVPQGSILGPTLYNIYTADIPTPEHCEIAQYADDTAIYTSSRYRKTLHNRLQEGIETLEHYFTKWRIKINETKTVAIIFGNTIKLDKPQQIQINQTTIPWSKQAVYLGITLDNKLTYKEHTRIIIQKLVTCMKKLYPLLNPKSKMSLNNKIKIIKAIMTPIATYASEIWYQASDNTRLKVQQKLNKYIRLAANAPWYVSNDQIRTELNIPTLETQIHSRTLNTINKIATHSNQTVREILTPYTRTHKGKAALQELKRKAEDNAEALYHCKKQRRR